MCISWWLKPRWDADDIKVHQFSVVGEIIIQFSSVYPIDAFLSEAGPTSKLVWVYPLSLSCHYISIWWLFTFCGSQGFTTYSLLLIMLSSWHIQMSRDDIIQCVIYILYVCLARILFGISSCCQWWWYGQIILPRWRWRWHWRWVNVTTRF